MRSIGVIGCGVVGGAVAKGFAERGHMVRTYDKYKPEHQDWDGCLKSEAVFVCVPTPTIRTTGKQDLHPLCDVLLRLKEDNYQGIIVVKCTLNSGTTEYLAKKYGLKAVVHNPEFLTAANPYDDFMNQVAVPLGSSNIKAAMEVGDMFTEAGFPNILLFNSATYTEKIKHARNGYLALKVGWANDQYDDCQSLGIDYNTMIQGMLALGGIEAGHLKVGKDSPEGKRGFGGMCFPKDSLAEYTHALERGVEMHTMGGAIQGNRIRRPEEYK